MKIENYKFGSMTVNGKTYTNDLIIFPDKIEPEWWREEGHSLSMNDLKTVTDYEPDFLVVGRGAESCMKIPEKTKEALKEKNIGLITGATGEMVKTFSQYIDEGKKAAGAFHLTC